MSHIFYYGIKKYEKYSSEFKIDWLQYFHLYFWNDICWSDYFNDKRWEHSFVYIFISLCFRFIVRGRLNILARSNFLYFHRSELVLFWVVAPYQSIEVAYRRLLGLLNNYKSVDPDVWLANLSDVSLSISLRWPGSQKRINDGLVDFRPFLHKTNIGLIVYKYSRVAVDIYNHQFVKFTNSVDQ